MSGLVHSQRDRDAVLDLCDAGRGPGDALRFLLLGPGAYRSGQDHFAALHVDVDAFRIHLGIADEGILDRLAHKGYAIIYPTAVDDQAD